MSTLRTEDGDASERELLVDDIQRIREVLHISGGANKFSSDEEGDDGSEEDEEEEDEPEKLGESLIGSTSSNLQSQKATYLSPLNSKTAIPGAVSRVEEVGERLPSDTRQDTVFIPPFVSPPHQLTENNLLPPQNTENVSSEEYTFTELQPVNFRSSTRALSTSDPSTCVSSSTVSRNTCTDAPYRRIPTSSTYSDGVWLMGTDQIHDHGHPGEEEDEDELFLEGGDVNDDDLEMRSEIQRCLSLNRDYQLAVLDELERIELALAKNREKQLGLHQMRASKDEGRPEPQTLVKFANPYFKDSGCLGPPDNDDTKIKRQSCQVEGYEGKSRCWNEKEKEALAEGVRMQNLENKLSPVLQKIQKLELKKNKTNTELQELEDLKAESSKIKNLPKEKLAYDLEGIDWDKLSNIYVPKRSEWQCRLQWCNFGHPDVNRTPWTKEEDKKLLQLAKDPQNSWVTIAQSLQTKRTPIHCYERYQRSLNKNLLKSKWTPEEDDQLIEIVRVVGLGNWRRVASFLEGRQGDQCMHRYTQTLQMVRKGKWTKEEDELLKKGIEKYGTCWSQLAEVVPGRSGPQCRERWVNALDPKIDKGAWTPQQDRKLLENVEKFGKGNWSKIARAMGNRTDNQCWRRWIVLRKDEFLYYRQNTLRKKRELVSNFTGRRQERPELEPEDLDIPDVPIVKKGRPGRIPLPPEESRERRRLTRAKSREKKRAEKRRAEEEAREKSTRTKRQVQYTEMDENEEEEEEEEEEMEEMEEEEEEEMEGVVDGEGGSSDATDEKKSPRIRKPGRSRSRVQQPHHRVLMRNKQLFKTKEVAEKRQERHTEKTVAVSGALGPFSLLLQAFSIDIPTVLRAIQNTSTTSSTSPPTSGTNVTPAAGNAAGVQTVTPGGQQEVQTRGGTGNQESQQTQASETSGVSAAFQSPASTEAGIRDVTTSSQPKPDQEIQEKVRTSSETDSEMLREKDKENTEDISGGSTLLETTVDQQNVVEVNNDGASNTRQVEVESAAAAPTSATAPTTDQVNRKRAPVIPPLPPCYTTLKTFKSLLMLKPQLQRIAAMLNPTSVDSTVGSQVCLPSAVRPGASSSTQSTNSATVSRVTCDARDKSCDGHVESFEQATERNDNVPPGKRGENVNKSRDNEIASDEDRVVSPGGTRDIHPRNVMDSNREHSASAENVVIDNRSSIGGTQPAKESLQISDNKTVSRQEKALEVTASRTVDEQDSRLTDSSTQLDTSRLQKPENDETVSSRAVPTETPPSSADSSSQHSNNTDDTLSTGFALPPEEHLQLPVDDKPSLGQAKRSETLASSSVSSLQGSNIADDTLLTGFALPPEEHLQLPEGDNPCSGKTKPPETPSSTSDSSALSGVVSDTKDKQNGTTSNEGINSRSPSARASSAVENNSQVPPAVSGATRTYRNSYEYKLLSSRFNSLFLWPALLSKIPVRFTSQIGPVFVQRYPPPRGGILRPSSEVAEKPVTRRKRKRIAKPPVPANPKRKYPGLAAVRMAYSTSFTTPAQQMCTVGQSSAIRKEANPERQPGANPSGENEVVVAASQLVSLHEATRSLSLPPAAAKSPYNTRLSKRKAVPVKRKAIIASSASSEEEEDDSIVIDLESDMSEPEWQPKGIRSLRNIRQACAQKAIVTRTRSAKSVSSVNETSATATVNTDNTKEVTSSQVILISSDSASEPQPSLRGVQIDVAGQQSSPARNQSSSVTNPSPSSSSKRKNPRPEKNRGARWRAMLPKFNISSDDSDEQ